MANKGHDAAVSGKGRDRERGQGKAPGFFIRRYLSFSGKVLISVLGVLVLSTVTMNLFYLYSQQESFEQEIDKDGRLLAGVLASNVRLGIFSRDSRQLAASLQTVFSVEEVVGACVYGPDGDLLNRQARPGWEEKKICGSPDSLPADLQDRPVNNPEVARLEEPQTIEFWSPVLAGPSEYTEEALFFGGAGGSRSADRRIGYVGVVFDKGPIRASIQSILTSNLVILFVFLIIGFGAAYYVIQGVSRPLNRLVRDIRNYGHTTDSVEAGDELGMLADTFSGMVTTIGDSFATINDLKQGLERKVDELQIEIGKRRKTEADLRESEEKFRTISENIADGVAIIVNSEFVWYNKAFSAIFGFRNGDKVDLEAAPLLPQAGRTHVLPSGRQEGSRYLVEALKKNGAPLLLEVHVRTIIYERRDAFQVIIRDITELDKAEKERKELEVKALGQSKLASLGKIATSVAHEVNQPLSFIKIAYESLLRDVENRSFEGEEMEKTCREALRQVDRITLITDHLRSFGRTDTSLSADVRMDEVLANSLTLMRESLRIAGITLEKEIDDKLPPVFGNSVKLEQVFINLLQNSVDALKDSGEKRIRIAMEREGAMVEICFSDTGPGIPPEVREHIFEPFFTTKRLEDRSGLGLGIVNNIVREHRGAIEYRQREGWGASFLIMLPASG